MVRKSFVESVWRFRNQEEVIVRWVEGRVADVRPVSPDAPLRGRRPRAALPVRPAPLMGTTVALVGKPLPDTPCRVAA
jgi:hypothetical protein